MNVITHLSFHLWVRFCRIKSPDVELFMRAWLALTSLHRNRASCHQRCGGRRKLWRDRAGEAGGLLQQAGQASPSYQQTVGPKWTFCQAARGAGGTRCRKSHSPGIFNGHLGQCFSGGWLESWGQQALGLILFCSSRTWHTVGTQQLSTGMFNKHPRGAPAIKARRCSCWAQHSACPPGRALPTESDSMMFTLCLCLFCSPCQECCSLCLWSGGKQFIIAMQKTCLVLPGTC